MLKITIFLFIFLFNLINSSNAKHLINSNQHIKSSSNEFSSKSAIDAIKNEANLQLDALVEKVTLEDNSKQSSNESAKESPNESAKKISYENTLKGTISSVNYEFEANKKWQKMIDGSEENLFQFFFDEKLQIAMNEELNFEHDKYQISFSYLIYRPDDKSEFDLELSSPSIQDDPNEEDLTNIPVKFDEWQNFEQNLLETKVTKRFAFKLELSKKNQKTEMPIIKNNSDKKYLIYIKNLKIKLILSTENEDVLIDLDDNKFNAIIDGNRISKENLSNYLLLPRLSEDMTSYFYTYSHLASFNWSLSNLDSKFSKDICIEFDYQASKDTLLKLKVLNQQNTNFFPVLDLDSTEFEDKSNLIKKTKWTKVHLCLRDLFSNSNELKKFYKLKFEPTIVKSVKRQSFIAITDLKVNEKEYKVKIFKNYLTNWKTNGTSAISEWTKFTDDTKLILSTEKEEIVTTNLEFVLERSQSYTSTKSVSLLSEWFEIEEHEELQFDIYSQFKRASYRILLLDYQMVSMDSSDIVEIKEDKETVTFKFLPTSVILFKSKPARIKLVINYSNEENLNATLKVANFHLSDPCYDDQLCNKKGNCLTLASNLHKCECNSDYSGKNCEFKNKCKQEIRPGKSGELYCSEHNGIKCIPVDNEFMCECEFGFAWNNFTNNCEYLSGCLFHFCDKNEVCTEDQNTKEPLCRCKLNYSRNEVTKKCEFNLCKNPARDDMMECGKNELCFSVIGEKERRCNCPIENKKVDDFCSDDKLENNPFTKQLHDCSHTYKIIKNEIVCLCYPGYKLDEDKKTCIGDLSEKCLPKCKPKEICVQAEQSDRFECRCRIGFDGPNCSNSYCKMADKEEIRHICGSDSCVDKRYSDDNIGFSCNCDKHVAHEDDYGLCSLKNVCDEANIQRCKARDAICLPKLDSVDRFLYGRCICAKGFDFDKKGKCVSICDLESQFGLNKGPYKDHCVIDFDTNQHLFDCRPGFSFNNETGKCHAAQNLLKINFDFKYRSLDTEKNEKNPSPVDYSTDEYYCENLSHKIECVKKMNLNRFKENRIEEPDFLANVKSKIANQIESSFKNLIEPSSIKRFVILSIRREGDLDYENDGLNEIYSIELFIEIDEKVNADMIKQNLEQVCLKDGLSIVEDVEPEVENMKENSLIDREVAAKSEHCVIRPYIYLINSEMKITEVNLCDEKENLIECGKNSNCEHNRKENRSSYRCKCSNGFEKRYNAKQHNIEFNTCTDIDECLDPKLNTCNKESTDCENILGSFRCNCKDNYKRMNHTHCTLICSKNICVHGKCQKFKKNYEICACHEGYKGDRCDTLDNKVVNLRTLLATISIILGLLLLVIIVITYLYVKKVESEDNQRLIKNEQMIAMDNVNHNYYENNYYNNKIDIRNMPRHSVQNDVIREEMQEELSDNENVTDF